MSAPASPPSPEAPAWPRSAQFAFVFLLGVIGTVVVSRFAPLLDRTRPTEQRLAVGVDLNQAGKAELMQLPHVSEKRAEEILAMRERRGGFESAGDLRAVKGIGPARAEELRPWVKAGDEQYLKPPIDSEPRRGKKEAPEAPIDVNRAGAEELQRLPGIGPVLASRIIAAREKAPFRTIDDLDRVSGIGPKTLAKLRPFVAVGSGQ